MSWRIFPKTFSKAKYAPYLALLYGFATFYIGLTINQQPQQLIVFNQRAGSSQTININIDLIKLLVGVVLSFGMVKIFHDMVEDEGKEQVNKYKETLEPKIQNLLKNLNNAKIEPELRDDCIEELNDILYLQKNDVEKQKAAQKIVKYLQKDENIKQLVKDSMKSIPIEFQKLFTKDIHNCLLWLRESLNYNGSAELDIEFLASANKSKMPGGIDNYKEALEYIKNFLENKSNHTGVVKDFVAKLIKYLDSEISK